ncbi:MAG: creatininase family protein [Candidatus Freyarchaeum deiterrae]
MKSVILPIGSTEQHGPHLPLGTDSIIAKRLSEAVATELKADILPVINYGVSFEHADFPGTVSIRPETLTQAVREICESLLKRYQSIVIINCHGGNTTTLRSLNCEKTVFIDFFIVLKKIINEVRETKIGGVGHACEVETSLMLYLEPHLVRREKITEDIVKYVPQVDPQSEEPLPDGWKTINFSKSGVIGDPTKATAEKGEKIFHLLVQKITETLKESQKGEKTRTKPKLGKAKKPK